MTQLFLAAQAAQGGGSMTSFLIMMVAIFAIMYFFMIRPQQKRQKEIQNFQNTLTEGAQVVTGGGIYGTDHRGKDCRRCSHQGGQRLCFQRHSQHAHAR